MKKLIDLVRIVTPNKLAKIDMFINKPSSSSKLQKLYKYLSSRKITDDETALKLLYDGQAENAQKLSVLKYDLKRKLLNSLLLISMNVSVAPRRAASLDLRKSLLTAHLLTLFGQKQYGIQMLERQLPKMLKFEFSLEVIEAARMIRQYYAINERDSEKVAYYNQLIEHQLKVVQLEDLADQYYYSLLDSLSLSTANQNALIELAQQYESDLKAKMIKNPGADLMYKSSMIAIIKCNLKFDYEQVVLICAKTVAFLQEKAYEHKTALFTIHMQWIRACLVLYDIPKAQSLSQSLECPTSVVGHNWFQFYKLQLQVDFRSRDYLSATRHFNILAQNIRHFEQNAALYEEFHFLALAMHLLSIAGALDLNPIKITLPSPEAITQDIRQLRKRKRELNIPIIIYPIVISILQKEYLFVIDRIMAIERYISRYLKDHLTSRHAIFFTEIIKLSRSNFDLKKYRPFSIPIEEKDFIDLDAELIPYENLQAFIVESLSSSTKRYRQSS